MPDPWWLRRTVHSFAEAFLKRNEPLHILINNAGALRFDAASPVAHQTPLHNHAPMTYAHTAEHVAACHASTQKLADGPYHLMPGEFVPMIGLPRTASG